MISMSILLNSLFGGLPFQTFSARNWEWHRDNKFNIVRVIDFLVWFEKDHCMNCWIRWYLGKYAIMSYDNREVCYEPLRRREANTD